MSEKIYRFFRGKWKPAWHRLPEQERSRMLKELSDAHDAEGIQSPLGGLIYTCWSSEWEVAGVAVYESMSALQDWSEKHKRMGWYEYMQQENTIGIMRDFPR